MKKISKKKNIIVATWMEDFSETLAFESYKYIRTYGKSIGEGAGGVIASKFVKHVISNLVLDHLNEYKGKKMSKEEAYEFTRQNFADIKMVLQNEIASGFEEAFMRYAGKQVEYYCIIKTVPEPMNKEPI